MTSQGFSGGSAGKKRNLPANAGDAKDGGLIPGSRRSLEKEMATHSSVLAWEISWTEKPGGLQSMESQSQTQLSKFTGSVLVNITTEVTVLFDYLCFTAMEPHFKTLPIHLSVNI